MSVSASSQTDCSLDLKVSRPASLRPVACPSPSAHASRPNEQPITSETSSLTSPLSPAEFVALKAKWLYETKRAGQSEDGFRYIARARLPGHLYEPFYRFNEEHDFSMSTGIQFAIYSLLKSHGF